MQGPPESPLYRTAERRLCVAEVTQLGRSRASVRARGRDSGARGPNRDLLELKTPRGRRQRKAQPSPQDQVPRFESFVYTFSLLFLCLPFFSIKMWPVLHSAHSVHYTPFIYILSLNVQSLRLKC